jgi:hypothetical protein
VPNRRLLLALIAGLITLAVLALAWSLRPKATESAAPLAELNYAEAASWAVRPANPPPAVWESGWALDVFVLNSAAAISSDADAARKAAETSKAMAAAFSGLGEVYAPHLRETDTTADAARAFLAYLATDNRGRAFLIATDLPLPDEFVSAIAEDPLLRDRFAGVLTFGENPVAGFSPSTETSSVCSRRYEAGSGCTLGVDIKRSGGRYTLDGEAAGGGALTSGLIAWLNDNAARLAEPLGELEEIEIIDIKQAPENE